MELVHCRSADAALVELQNCPLVEIVHFHKVLRGEMLSLVQLYKELRTKLEAETLSREVRVMEESIRNRFRLLWSVFQAHSTAEDNTIWPALHKKLGPDGPMSSVVDLHEIVEDHRDEEKCFKEISLLLCQLQSCLEDRDMRRRVALEVEVSIEKASKQLLDHLEKEETQVLPFIQRCFTQEEMAQLVGQIMGHRSSDIMQTILGMMVQHLSAIEREQMLKHMQTAVKDTYFARWLSLLNTDFNTLRHASKALEGSSATPSSQDMVVRGGSAPSSPSTDVSSASRSDALVPTNRHEHTVTVYHPEPAQQKSAAEDELTAAIKMIAKCDGLSSEEKTRVMQCLRMSSSKKTSRQCDHSGGGDCEAHNKRSRTGSIGSLSHDHPAMIIQPDGTILTDCTQVVFSPEELRPAFQTAGGALGCSHYARTCRLLAPCCNQLHVCRLCHDENSDHALDRFSVRQVLCMRCNTLQPSSDRCQNPDCGTQFARYYCSICNLFDDDPTKSIYHCPYCNVCRKGKGLGIDFYHCMRCNACIRIEDEATHSCLSHSMERSCPICQRYLFDSVDVLKGLKCGHVMHLSCYRQYRVHKYYCPLCHKTMEDMSHEWEMIDHHLETSGLPNHLIGWRTKIHCHDCTAHSTTQYRLDYHKCSECGSYNTRTDGAPTFAGIPT